ncbi:FAD-dependent oxidoreductase, partial [Thermodesulfobacteriota bacterium]
TDKLGGQWYIASQQEQKKQDYPKFMDYLSRGLDKTGIKVHLNTEGTPELVRDAKPDVTVVATSAIPKSLDVPGADGKNVVQATDIILGKAGVGDRVVVVGGRNLGMEIADQLASSGKKVFLITRRALGRGVERNVYFALRNRLIEKGIQFFTNSPVVEIRENGVYFAFENELVFIEANTVVLAVGASVRVCVFAYK